MEPNYVIVSHENESKERIFNRNMPLLHLTMPSKYLKCGEVFVEETLKLTLVCSLCGKQFTEMELFGAHITCVHLSSEKLEPVLLQTVKEEIKIEENPFQDGNSIYESTYGMAEEPNEMDKKLNQVKEEDNDNILEYNTKNKSSNSTRKNRRKYLEHERWKECCSRCGLRFKTKDDYMSHKKLTHINVGIEDKSKLEKLKDSSVYAPYTCPICYCKLRFKYTMEMHLKSQHHIGPEHIKEVLKIGFFCSRDYTEQTLADDECWRRIDNKPLLGTKLNAEQMQPNVQKQQLEAIDPEPSGADVESQAIKQEFSKVTINLETTNSMPEGVGLKEEIFETEMDLGIEKHSIDVPQTSNQPVSNLGIQADEEDNVILVEDHMVDVEQTASKITPKLEWRLSKNKIRQVPYCGPCGYEFRFKLGCLLHEQLKHGHLPLEIKQELKMKTNKYSFILETIPFTCFECGSELESIYHLKAHWQMDHDFNFEMIRKLIGQKRRTIIAKENQEDSIEQFLKHSEVKQIEAVLRECQEKADATTQIQLLFAKVIASKKTTKSKSRRKKTVNCRKTVYRQKK